MNRRPFRFFQSIYFKIPLLLVFILLISFQFIGVYFVDQLETQSVANFKNQINTQVDFLTNNLSPILKDNQQPREELIDRVAQTIKTFSSSNPTEITVVNTESVVIGVNQDLKKNLVETKFRLNDPYIKHVIVSKRSILEQLKDPVSGKQTYHLIKPILTTDEEPQVLGAVEVKADMSPVYNQTNSVMDIFIQSALLAVVVAIVSSVGVSQGLTRPIENMRQQAIRISEGVYNYPADVYGVDELGELAITVNELALKVKDAQDSIESERQRLDGILRHMTDGVIGTDQRGNVLLVNDRALTLLNVTHEFAVSQSIIKLLKIGDNYSLRDLMHRDTEIFLTRTSEQDFETIIKCEFAVIRRETGFVTGLVCVLTDVTEQEKTEQERRDFVSNVSHELRTPLTSIKSYSEALADGAWQNQEIAPQFVDVILSESNRMIRMIANLLDLSKMDGNQLVVNAEYIDFKRIVNHILDRLEFTLTNNPNGNNYHIVRDFTSREIYVEIDQDRMTQVIDNILNNAIKYSPDGGTITVKIEDNHRSVIMSVSDEGLGIPQKDLPHLFERFYRVDKARSRQQGGTGLGLAISKEVIEHHGGRIWATSVEGVGSTFSFELPYTSFDTMQEEEWD